MASSLPTIRDALKTRLATITGLRCYDVVPAKPELPAGVVGIPESVTYNLTFGGGATWILPIRVYVSNADPRSAQEALDLYIAPTGTKSIKAAIEGDISLGGAVDTCRVTQARNYGVFPIADIDHLGCEFVVEIVTST